MAFLIEHIKVLLLLLLCIHKTRTGIRNECICQCDWDISLESNRELSWTFSKQMCNTTDTAYMIRMTPHGQNSSEPEDILSCMCSWNITCKAKPGYSYSITNNRITLTLTSDDRTSTFVFEKLTVQDACKCTRQFTQDPQPEEDSTSSTAPTTGNPTTTKQDASSESNTGSLVASIMRGILEAVLIAALIFSHLYVHKKHQQEVDQRTETLKEKNQRIQNLDNELQQKNQRIWVLEDELQQKNQRIRVLEDELNTNTDISNGQRQDLPVPGVGAALRPASQTTPRPASQIATPAASQTTSCPASQTAPRPASQTAPHPASQTAPRPASQTAPRLASQTAPRPASPAASQTTSRPALTASPAAQSPVLRASVAASSPVMPSSTSSKLSTICTQNTTPGISVLGNPAVQYNPQLTLGSPFDGYSVGEDGPTGSSSMTGLNDLENENGQTELDTEIMQGDDAPGEKDSLISNVKRRENSEQGEDAQRV